MIKDPVWDGLSILSLKSYNKDLISENKDVFQSPCCGGITCKEEMNKWIDSNVKIIDGKLTCPCCGRNLVEFIKKSASC